MAMFQLRFLSHGARLPLIAFAMGMLAAGVMTPVTALAEEPREILLKVVQGGDYFTAGEVTITAQATYNVDGVMVMKPYEASLLAFDRETKSRRWSIWHPQMAKDKDMQLDTIDTPEGHYYQQGPWVRFRFLSPKILTREGPLDLRILGRVPFKWSKDRYDLAKALKELESLKVRQVENAPAEDKPGDKSDDESIVTLVCSGQTGVHVLPDKKIDRMHYEDWYRIDTKRNIVLSIKTVLVHEDLTFVEPHHEDRFTWKTIDDVLVPVKLEQIAAEKDWQSLEYHLDWTSTNKANVARFSLDDLPPLKENAIYFDETNRENKATLIRKKRD
jgi:hypothetical protein